MSYRTLFFVCQFRYPIEKGRRIPQLCHKNRVFDHYSVSDTSVKTQSYHFQWKPLRSKLDEISVACIFIIFNHKH